jgi:hypothetical protein
LRAKKQDADSILIVKLAENYNEIIAGENK